MITDILQAMASELLVLLQPMVIQLMVQNLVIDFTQIFEVSIIISSFNFVGIIQGILTG